MTQNFCLLCLETTCAVCHPGCAEVKKFHILNIDQCGKDSEIFLLC